VFIWSDVTDTTAGDFLYLAGVQLEAGAVATPFERRPFGTELALCQRYYFQYGGAFDGSSNFPEIGIGIANNTTQAYILVDHMMPMRALPTLTFSTIRLQNVATGYAITSAAIATVNGSKNNSLIICDVASGLTAGNTYFLDVNNSSSGFLGLSSEL
jgi:hypothetical protein